MAKNLNELAREIMAGKKVVAESGDPLERVTDHGPAIVHPLQKQGVNYAAGSPGQDNTVPGADGKQEKFNPTNKDVGGPAKSGSAPSSKDHSIPGSDKGGEKFNPTSTKEKASGDETGKPGDGPNGKTGEPYNPTRRTQSVKEDADRDNAEILEGKVEIEVDTDDKKDNKKDKSDKKDKKDSKDDDDDKDDKKPAFLKKEAKEASDRALKEHVDAMLSGENLTEEFKKKASTIFEAAVAERAATIREELEEEFAGALSEAIEVLKTEQEGKLDDYMSYVAKEWLKENEVAIESGMKTQIADDFLNGLRGLFVEHHIDIPAEKVDVVEELSEEVEALEESLNDEIAKSVELSKELSGLRRACMVIEARQGLTDVQVSKLDKLVEGISADTDEEFQEKLNTVRESYTGEKTPVGKSVTEDKDPASNEKKEEGSGPMSRYVDAIKQTPWRSK